MKVVLYHLFPDLLNLYGDFGNISALKFHLESLDIKVEYKKIDDIKDFNEDELSFLLIGGGSDREQEIATKELMKVKSKLNKLIKSNLPILAVCGGYQFLGKTYECLDGKVLKGLGLFDITTIATNKRMVGNIVVESDLGLLVGFENHSGETRHDLERLGKIKYGYGNNFDQLSEGLRVNNLVGTYMHGPILPKNYMLTKFFIEKICEYNKFDVDLDKLDFDFEKSAHDELIAKFQNDFIN